MAKVLSCIAKPSQDGSKTYYNVALQKGDTQIGAFAFAQVQPGEEIDDSRIIPDKQGTGWVIKSADRSGFKGGYQRNDDLIIAQVAFKGAYELLIANKLNAADLTSETCIKFAQIIKRTAAAIAAPGGAPAPSGPSATAYAGQLVSQPAGQPPSAHAADPSKVPPPPIIPNGPIKSMGELRTKIAKAYPTLKTVAAQDAILGDTKQITDYEAAFQKVVEAMEGEIKW